MARVRYTYIIQSMGLVVKIGRSSNHKGRLQNLQGAHADPLIILALLPTWRIEETLQKRFEHLRIRGEWYSYIGDLKQYVESLDFDPISVDDFLGQGCYLSAILGKRFGLFPQSIDNLPTA